MNGNEYIAALTQDEDKARQNVLDKESRDCEKAIRKYKRDRELEERQIAPRKALEQADQRSLERELDAVESDRLKGQEQLQRERHIELIKHHQSCTTSSIVVELPSYWLYSKEQKGSLRSNQIQINITNSWLILHAMNKGFH